MQGKWGESTMTTAGKKPKQPSQTWRVKQACEFMQGLKTLVKSEMIVVLFDRAGMRRCMS